MSGETQETICSAAIVRAMDAGGRLAWNEMAPRMEA
jgi:hypothetical protein